MVKSNSNVQFVNEKLFYPKRITIASFPGGKSDKRKHQPLFHAIPKKIDYLIEPFAGLANFFLVISPRVSRVWLNDKDPEIYSLLLCLNDYEYLTQLIEYIQSLEPVTRDDYYHWKQKIATSTLESAVRRLVLLNCSPNGAGGGYSSEKAHRKWYQNKPKVWKLIQDIFSAKTLKITNLDYYKVLLTIQDAQPEQGYFCYLDPPYFDVAKRGNLYGKEYNQIDLKKLIEELSNLSFHWILSNRDSPEVRDYCQGFNLIGYNTYNDMNNTRNRNPELLVSNFPFNLR